MTVSGFILFCLVPEVQELPGLCVLEPKSVDEKHLQQSQGNPLFPFTTVVTEVT